MGISRLTIGQAETALRLGSAAIVLHGAVLHSDPV